MRNTSAYRDLDRMALRTPSSEALGEIDGRLSLERMALMPSQRPGHQPLDELAVLGLVCQEPLPCPGRTQMKEDHKATIVETPQELVDDEPWSNGGVWVSEEEFVGS